MRWIIQVFIILGFFCHTNAVPLFIRESINRGHLTKLGSIQARTGKLSHPPPLHLVTSGSTEHQDFNRRIVDSSMHDKDPPIHQSYPVEAIVGVTAAATIMIFYVGVVIFKGLMVIMSESGRGYVAINQDEAKCEPKMEGTIMIGKGKEKDPKPPGGKPVQYYLPPIKDHRSSGDTVSGLARL